MFTALQNRFTSNIQQPIGFQKSNKVNTGYVRNWNISFGKETTLKPLETDVFELREAYFDRTKIEPTVNLFREKLIELSKTGHLTTRDIKKLIDSMNLHIKVSVDDIKRYPGNEGSIAKCVTNYSDGRAESSLLLNCDVENNRIIQNATHEFTHLLQDNALDETSYADMSRRYGGVVLHSNAFREFELKFLDHNYFNDVNERANSINRQLSECKSDNPLEMFNFNDPQRARVYDELIEDVFAQNNIRNKKFALEFFKLQTLDEAQAYEEGFKTKKILANIPVKTLNHQDLLAKMYYDLAKYLDQKISEL